MKHYVLTSIKREKKKQHVYIIQEPWDIIKPKNPQDTKNRDTKKKTKGKGNPFNEIMTEKFLNLEKEMDIQMQEA